LLAGLAPQAPVPPLGGSAARRRPFLGCRRVDTPRLSLLARYARGLTPPGWGTTLRHSMHGQRVSEIRFGRRLPRESRLGLLGGPRLSGCSPRSACGCGQAPGRRYWRPADTGSSPSSACGQAPGRPSACLSRRDIPGSMRPVPLRHAWPADPARPGALASAVGYRGRLRLQSPPPRYGFLVIFPGPGTTQSGEPRRANSDSRGDFRGFSRSARAALRGSFCSSRTSSVLIAATCCISRSEQDRTGPCR
jgi:hypothetical protein